MAPSAVKRASARARWSRIRASRPIASGSSGMRRTNSEVSHSASRARSRRSAVSPADARYPSLKMRYRTASTWSSRGGSSASSGTR